MRNIAHREGIWLHYLRHFITLMVGARNGGVGDKQWLPSGGSSDFLFEGKYPIAEVPRLPVGSEV